MYSHLRSRPLNFRALTQGKIIEPGSTYRTNYQDKIPFLPRGVSLLPLTPHIRHKWGGIQLIEISADLGCHKKHGQFQPPATPKSGGMLIFTLCIVIHVESVVYFYKPVLISLKTSQIVLLTPLLRHKTHFTQYACVSKCSLNSATMIAEPKESMSFGGNLVQRVTD